VNFLSESESFVNRFNSLHDVGNYVNNVKSIYLCGHGPPCLMRNVDQETCHTYVGSLVCNSKNILQINISNKCLSNIRMHL